MAKRKKKITKKTAPTEVKIISIWIYLQSISLFLMGILFILLRKFISNFIEYIQFPKDFGVTPLVLIQFVSIAFIVAGVILLMLGLFYYFIARGLWNGKSWARTTELVIAVTGAIFGLGSLPGGMAGLVISGLIIWYLGFNQEGKDYFS